MLCIDLRTVISRFRLGRQTRLSIPDKSRKIRLDVPCPHRSSVGRQAQGIFPIRVYVFGFVWIYTSELSGLHVRHGSLDSTGPRPLATPAEPPHQRPPRLSWPSILGSQFRRRAFRALSAARSARRGRRAETPASQRTTSATRVAAARATRTRFAERGYRRLRLG